MSFREQVVNDLVNTFLNPDEFAEHHRIEGAEILVVVDSDQMDKLKEGKILGIVEADLLLMGKESDFHKDLSEGRLLNMDGKEMIVVKSGKSMGLVEVALRQNRTR